MKKGYLRLLKLSTCCAFTVLGIAMNSYAIGFGDQLVDAVDRGDQNAVSSIIKAKKTADTVGDLGVTPLMRAAYRGDYDIATLILQAKPYINAADVGGETALHLAARRGDLKLSSLLIKNGANINIQDKEGFTPIMRAIMAKNNDLVKEFVESGADINLSNDNGDTALTQSLKIGQNDVIDTIALSPAFKKLSKSQISKAQDVANTQSKASVSEHFSQILAKNTESAKIASEEIKEKNKEKNEVLAQNKAISSDSTLKAVNDKDLGVKIGSISDLTFKISAIKSKDNKIAETIDEGSASNSSNKETLFSSANVDNKQASVQLKPTPVKIETAEIKDLPWLKNKPSSLDRNNTQIELVKTAGEVKEVKELNKIDSENLDFQEIKDIGSQNSYHNLVAPEKAANIEADKIAVPKAEAKEIKRNIVPKKIAKPVTSKIAKTTKNSDATKNPIITDTNSSIYTVQLGVFPSQDDALFVWNSLSKKNKDLLGNYTPILKKIGTEQDNNILYRLRAGNFADKTAAKKLCGSLLSRNMDCFVVEMDKSLSQNAKMVMGELHYDKLMQGQQITTDKNWSKQATKDTDKNAAIENKNLAIVKDEKAIDLAKAREITPITSQVVADKPKEAKELKKIAEVNSVPAGQNTKITSVLDNAIFITDGSLPWLKDGLGAPADLAVVPTAAIAQAETKSPVAKSVPSSIVLAKENGVKDEPNLVVAKQNIANSDIAKNEAAQKDNSFADNFAWQNKNSAAISSSSSNVSAKAAVNNPPKLQEHIYQDQIKTAPGIVPVPVVAANNSNSSLAPKTENLSVTTLAPVVASTRQNTAQNNNQEIPALKPEAALEYRAANNNGNIPLNDFDSEYKDFYQDVKEDINHNDGKMVNNKAVSEAVLVPDNAAHTSNNYVAGLKSRDNSSSAIESGIWLKIGKFNSSDEATDYYTRMFKYDNAFSRIKMMLMEPESKSEATVFMRLGPVENSEIAAVCQIVTANNLSCIQYGDSNLQTKKEESKEISLKDVNVRRPVNNLTEPVANNVNLNWVQLGSFANSSEAEYYWMFLSQDQGDIISNFSYNLKDIKNEAFGPEAKLLQMGPFAAKAQAESACAALKNRGVSCFVE